jgi:hypothetical protein
MSTTTNHPMGDEAAGTPENPKQEAIELPEVSSLTGTSRSSEAQSLHAFPYNTYADYVKALRYSSNRYPIFFSVRADVINPVITSHILTQFMNSFFRWNTDIPGKHSLRMSM